MSKKFLYVILSSILALSSLMCYAADIPSENEDAKNDTALPYNESYEELFVKDNVIDINIEINDSDLQDMFDYAINEEYHSADITVNGIKVENAGIRTKGNMTLSSVANSDSDRYSFRIKFDKYVKGQTYLGLDELCLNNCYSDATYMREYLHYEILEKLGMNVPKRSYCNVYTNGELFGFYIAVEALDDTFLEREFGENYENGTLYKMDMGSTLEYKEDENYTYADRKSGPDKDLTEFKSFVKKLNEITEGEKGDTDSFLNVESALKYIASNTVLCNYDSYNGNNHHNFYLYRDEQGVFTVIPWDFNMSFGGFGGKNTTVGIDTPIISGSVEKLPLIGKLLSIDEYKEQYYGYIKEIMTMLENFEDRVTELKKIITPYVENDPTAFYSPEDFDKSTALQDADDVKIENTEKNFEQNESEDIRNEQDRSRNERRPGGEQPFGGTDSIINCVIDRLENLKQQFNGTAEKKTVVANDRENGKPGQDFAPPEMDWNGEAPPNDRPPENWDNGEQPSEKPNFDRQPPDNQVADWQPPNFEDFQERQNLEPGNENSPRWNNNREKNNVIRVHVDGHIVTFDTSPFIENDTTLVGFRGIFEALGASVEWNEETQAVTAIKDDTVIVLNIGSDTAYVNGEAYTLLAAPTIADNSTMIPVRFISEQLGMKVSWDGETRLITVSSK